MSALLNASMYNQEYNQIRENRWSNENQNDWPEIRALRKSQERHEQDRNHRQKWEQRQDSPTASRALDRQELENRVTKNPAENPYRNQKGREVHTQTTYAVCMFPLVSKYTPDGATPKQKGNTESDIPRPLHRLSH